MWVAICESNQFFLWVLIEAYRYVICASNLRQGDTRGIKHRYCHRYASLPSRSQQSKVNKTTKLQRLASKHGLSGMLPQQHTSLKSARYYNEVLDLTNIVYHSIAWYLIHLLPIARDDELTLCQCFLLSPHSQFLFPYSSRVLNVPAFLVAPLALHSPLHSLGDSCLVLSGLTPNSTAMIGSALLWDLRPKIWFTFSYPHVHESLVSQ